MLYYADGGPGPASKLLRVDASPTGEYGAWRKAKGYRWSPPVGWFAYPDAQNQIEQFGEFFMINPDDVPKVQQDLRDKWAAARR